MNIVASLHFNHGEWIERRLQMPDSSKPTTVEEYIERSKKAMLHFWPHAAFGKPKDVITTEVEVAVIGGSAGGLGTGWSVSWRTDGFDAWQEETMTMLLSPETFPAAIERLTGAQPRAIQKGAKAK